MATRSNPKKQRRGKRPPQKRPSKRPPKQSGSMSDAEREDLELAEELLRPPSPEEQAGIEVELKKFRKALKKLGINLPAKPIGAKKLRERMVREGFDPEGNEFSRGIIEMREE